MIPGTCAIFSFDSECESEKSTSKSEKSTSKNWLFKERDKINFKSNNRTHLKHTKRAPMYFVRSVKPVKQINEETGVISWADWTTSSPPGLIHSCSHIASTLISFIVVTYTFSDCEGSIQFFWRAFFAFHTIWWYVAQYGHLKGSEILIYWFYENIYNWQFS